MDVVCYYLLHIYKKAEKTLIGIVRVEDGRYGRSATIYSTRVKVMQGETCLLKEATAIFLKQKGLIHNLWHKAQQYAKLEWYMMVHGKKTTGVTVDQCLNPILDSE